MEVNRPLALALAAALLCGCVSQYPAPAPVLDVPDGPQVQVDWSKLEEETVPRQPDLDGGRWYTETVETLIPREDYGVLFPYVGATVTAIDTWIDNDGVEQSYISDPNSPVYGLMTRDGKVVTDPVYQSVYQPVYRYGSEVTALPVLMLGQADEAWQDHANGLRYAVAARDGSWCTDFEFWTYAVKDSVLLLVGPDGVTRLDSETGERQDWSWTALRISESEIDGILETLMWLYGFQWLDAGALLGLIEAEEWNDSKVRLFDPESGQISLVSIREWEDMMDASQQYDWATRDEWDFARDLETIILIHGDESYAFPIPDGLNILHDVEVNGDLALLRDYSGQGLCWLYHLPSGAMLALGSYIGFLKDSTDLDAPAYVWVDDGQGSHHVYTPDFISLLTVTQAPNDPAPTFILQDGLLFAQNDAAFFGCYDAQTGGCIFYRNLNLGD